MKSALLQVLFISLIFSAVLNSCKKDEPTVDPSTEPVLQDLETISASVYQDGGVTFKGKVNKIPVDANGYGFLVARDSLFSKNVWSYNISTPITVGDFKTDVNIGLVKDSVYYVTAYVLTQSRVKTFNVKKFLSNGAKTIKIDSIYPSKALIGDTLSLKGKYFTGHSLSIKFGDRIGTLISVNDSLIRVSVPSDLRIYNPIITLTEGSKIDTISKVFSLYTPKIDEFTTLGTFRDTVVIKGNYFSKLLNGNQVSFGNIAASVVSYTRQQLKVIVPDDIEFSKTIISLKAQLQTVSTPTPFTIRKPELSSIPQSGNINDVVSIVGKNFHPVLSKNQVSFEGNPAKLNSGNTSQFSLNVPNGPYPNRTASFVLKVLDYEITYPVAFDVKDKWIMVNNKVPFSEYTNSGSFKINNVAYVISGSKDFLDYKKYVWKFNPVDFSWQKTEIPFSFTTAIVAASGNKAYLYITADSDNFWEYDPSANQWSKKTNYPSNIRQSSAMFSIGGDVYLGMGRNPLPFAQFQPDNSFYKYNVSANRWEKETDYPTESGNGERIIPSTFILEDKVYLGCGSTNTGAVQFHSYSPKTKTWTKLNDFPDARYMTTAFTYSGNGYIATGTTVGGSPTRVYFKYDVAGNKWLKMTDYIGVPALESGIEKGYAFEINGKIYFGGGNSSSNKYELFMAEGNSL